MSSLTLLKKQQNYTRNKILKYLTNISLRLCRAELADILELKPSAKITSTDVHALLNKFKKLNYIQSTYFTELQTKPVRHKYMPNTTLEKIFCPLRVSSKD